MEAVRSCETAVSTYHHYLLHEAVFLEKLTGSQLGKKFPAFYITRKLMTAFNYYHTQY